MRKIFLAAVSVLLLPPFFAQNVKAQSWSEVHDIDLNKLKPADFRDNELDLPYYLKHFHTVANSVVPSGPEKGFIKLAVWRRPQDNQPYNARIMESILSLAYFYSTNRPWNAYYMSDAVKVRIEAALGFWINLQDSSGKFSEYGPEKWNLAGTSFATMCMGRTLELLTKSKGIDSGIMNRVKEADRKAIMCILTDTAFYNHGKNFTNQFTACFPGALAYLKLFPDQEMQTLLTKKMDDAKRDFQSPAGFFYEAGGTDHGYNLNTHHSNSRLIYDYTHGTALGEEILEEEKRYVDWIAYHAVPEPDGAFFTLNRGTETRTPAPVIAAYFLRSPMGESVELLRAFTPSREETERVNKQKRKLLTESWPEVGKLVVYSPTILLHLDRYQWFPTNKQKDTAHLKLPYKAKKQFIHQRMDNRLPVIFTFIKQPTYYAAFNSGPVTGSRQRYGLGLLWHPAAGSFLQSQASSDSAAWGTKGSGRQVYEAGSMSAEMFINGKKVMSKPGAADLADGILSVQYALGKKGRKNLLFNKNGIEVAVEHQGAFTEYLPLLLKDDDQVDISQPGLILLTKGKTTIQVLYDKTGKVGLKKTSMVSGNQTVFSVTIESKDKLNYTIQSPL